MFVLVFSCVLNLRYKHRETLILLGFIPPPSSPKIVHASHQGKFASSNLVTYRLGKQLISLELPDTTKKEIDFTDTLFFTTSPNRHLPTPAQVRALSKDIDTSPQPTPIMFGKSQPDCQIRSLCDNCRGTEFVDDQKGFP